MVSLKASLLLGLEKEPPRGDLAVVFGGCSTEERDDALFLSGPDGKRYNRLKLQHRYRLGLGRD